MTGFRSHRSYEDFVASVRHDWRYVRPQEQSTFLETLLATSAARVQVVPARTVWCRAQVGYECETRRGRAEEPIPFPLARMKPLRHCVCEGRANPKGIPYLYLATHPATAVAEVRPWVGTCVSVARFITNRDLRLINCTTDDAGGMIYLREPGRAERERAVWRAIDRGFCTPVTVRDNVADYAPTQIIAELFRLNRFDGIGYRSALGPGHNIALFDLDAADAAECSLVRVGSVRIAFKQASNVRCVK